MQHPIPYSPSVETIGPDEDDTIRELVDTLRGIMEKTSGEYGHAVRSVAKSHGIIEGELEVLPNLPPELAQGMFARPGRDPSHLDQSR